MTQRGGKRGGAGRKPSKVVEARKVIAASGNGQVLATVNENKIWRGLINCRDPRIKLDAMKYLTDRRDGKATQSLNANTTITRTPEQRLARLNELIALATGKTQ